MRIKFERGFTPERIGDIFAHIIRGEGVVIGAVNIYVQVYDENMMPIKYSQEDEYIVIKPEDVAKKEYTDDSARTRRKRFEVV